MTQNEKEFDEAVKETKCFCPAMIKGLLSAVKEESTIPEYVIEILDEFKELTAYELRKDLPPMRDKLGGAIVFQCG